MSIDVPSQGDDFIAAVPRPLFQTRIPAFGLAYRAQIAAARAGDRFLLNVGSEASVWPSVTIVLNWTAAISK